MTAVLLRRSCLSLVLFFAIQIPFAVSNDSVLSPKQQMSAHTADLRTLMRTLYAIYPKELAKSTKVSAREFTEWVFEGKANWKFEAVRRLQGKAAMALWDDPDYQSDLILPMIVGLESRLFMAYGAQNEYQIPDVVSTKSLKQTACGLRLFARSLRNKAGDARLKYLFDQPQGINAIQATVSAVISRISHQNAIVLSQCTNL